MVDIGNTQTIQVMNVPGETYEALAQSEQRTLKADIRSTYPNGDTVLDRIESWKKVPNNAPADRHERVYKDLLTITVGTRGDTGYSPKPDELQIATRLHDLSKDVLVRRLGNQFTIYRGPGYEEPYLVMELLEDPTASTVTIPSHEQSALSNYTSVRRRAACYSPLLLTQSGVHPEDVALAANYIFVFTDPDADDEMLDQQDRVSPDAELRVRGDREYPVRTDQLSIIVGDPTTQGAWNEVSATDFVQKCPNYSHREHEVMRELMENLATNDDVNITDQQAKTRVRNWKSQYEQDTGNQFQEDITDVVA